MTSSRNITLGFAGVLVCAGVTAGVWQLDRFGALSPTSLAQPSASNVSGLPARLGQEGEPLHLAILGTSLSYQGDWPDRLAAALSACRNAGVRVRRIAQPGASSDWGALALETALERPPDLLLAEFSINDASLAHGVPVARAKATLNAMLRRTNAASVPTLLLSMNPAWGRERWERPGHAAYLTLYAQAAAAGMAGYLSTLQDWLALPEAVRTTGIPDGLHPSPELVARIQIPALVLALGPRACDPGQRPYFSRP